MVSYLISAFDGGAGSFLTDLGPGQKAWWLKAKDLIDHLHFLPHHFGRILVSGAFPMRTLRELADLHNLRAPPLVVLDHIVPHRFTRAIDQNALLNFE
jgi:hypothetical protein